MIFRNCLSFSYNIEKLEFKSRSSSGMYIYNTLKIKKKQCVAFGDIVLSFLISSQEFSILKFNLKLELILYVFYVVVVAKYFKSFLKFVNYKCQKFCCCLETYFSLLEETIKMKPHIVFLIYYNIIRAKASNV